MYVLLLLFNMIFQEIPMSLSMAETESQKCDQRVNAHLPGSLDSLPKCFHMYY